MDAVDKNLDLTPIGKKKERARLAEKAIAYLEASEVLKKAQWAVERQEQKWREKLGEVVKPAEDVHTAMCTAKSSIVSPPWMLPAACRSSKSMPVTRWSPAPC
jgi:hypothetical protein